MYNYQSRLIAMAIKSNQTRSFQVYCCYAIKAGLELCINASLVGYPYIFNAVILNRILYFTWKRECLSWPHDVTPLKSRKREK